MLWNMFPQLCDSHQRLPADQTIVHNSHSILINTNSQLVPPPAPQLPEADVSQPLTQVEPHYCPYVYFP